MRRWTNSGRKEMVTSDDFEAQARKNGATKLILRLAGPPQSRTTWNTTSNYFESFAKLGHLTMIHLIRKTVRARWILTWGKYP